jgi:hypothetical protein
MRPIVPASGVNEPQPRDYDLSASILPAVVGFPDLHYSMRSFGKLQALGETCCSASVLFAPTPQRHPLPWHRTRVCVGHKRESVRAVNRTGREEKLSKKGYHYTLIWYDSMKVSRWDVPGDICC